MLLSSIPLELKAAAALIALVSVFLAIHLWTSSIRKDATVVCQASYQAAALKAETEARDEEQRRTTAQSEIVNESQRVSARARTDSDGFTAARDRLQQRATASNSQGSCNPQVASGGAPASAAAGVSPDVLGRCTEAVGLYAGVATVRGISGNACQQSYDSLGPTQP